MRSLPLRVLLTMWWLFGLSDSFNYKQVWEVALLYPSEFKFPSENFRNSVILCNLILSSQLHGSVPRYPLFFKFESSQV